jgi:hypothetical protein
MIIILQPCKLLNTRVGSTLLPNAHYAQNNFRATSELTCELYNQKVWNPNKC